MGYTHYITQLLDAIEKIAIVGGYPFLFLSVVLEGIPLVGTLVPGHVAIITGGFLIRVGVFNVWITLILSIAGAVIGDYIGYYLGRKYGLSLIDRVKPYFFITDTHIAKVQDLLSKHTGKSMILGRLSPMTRALMPFVVGANHTSEKRFWLYNFIGGSLWAISSVILGYAFGAGYQAAAGYTGKFILIAVVVSLVIMWGYRFVNVRFHFFKKYELFMLILNVLSLWTLAQTIQDTLIVNQKLAALDVSINSFMFEHIAPIWQNISLWINSGMAKSLFIAVCVLAVAFYVFKKRWRSASIMILSLASTSILVGLMKDFFLRARPENALTVLSDPSFPSGHAAVAAAFFIIVAYLSMPRIQHWVWRELTLVGCVLAFVAIGLSRVVINVHWASDIFAGWALGIFCATSSVLLVRYVGGFFRSKGVI